MNPLLRFSVVTLLALLAALFSAAAANSEPLSAASPAQLSLPVLNPGPERQIHAAQFLNPDGDHGNRGPDRDGAGVYERDGAWIPNPGFIDFPIVVENAPPNATITGMRIELEGDHDRPADMIIRIFGSAANRENILWNQEGDDDHGWFGLDFWWDFFDGDPVNQTYTLRVEDVSDAWGWRGNTGFLDYFRITLEWQDMPDLVAHNAWIGWMNGDQVVPLGEDQHQNIDILVHEQWAIGVDFHNDGPVAANGWRPAFIIGGRLYEIDGVVNTAANAQNQWVWKTNLANNHEIFTPGDHTLVVALDYTEAVAEGNEENNVAVREYSIGVPDIEVDPDPLAFPDVLLGNNLERDVNVGNAGFGTLVVDAPEIIGANADQFSIIGPRDPFNVPPHVQPRQLGIRFSPTSPGFKQAVLRFYSNDPDENPVDVSLTGTCVSPDISVDPGAHNFGNRLLGSATELSLAVSNTGNYELRVDAPQLIGENWPEFQIVSGGDAFTIAPGGQPHNITVRFAPASVGFRQAALRLSSNDPDENPMDIGLTGTGVGVPDIVVNPDISVIFGDVPLGGNRVMTVLVNNSGDAVLSVGAPTIIGNDANQFSIVSGGGAFNLNRGEERTIAIRFAPNSPGAKQATLRLSNNDPDENPTDVRLTGVGVGIPDIAVAPPVLNYGDIGIGSSRVLTVTVSNTGSGDLNVNPSEIVGENANQYSIVSGGEAFVITPGGQPRAINIRFAPTSPGELNAALRIASDDPDENPVDVPLVGVGHGPDVAVDPEALSFGGIRLGEFRDLSVTVSNTGNVNLHIFSLGISGNDGNQFPIIAYNGSYYIAPGGSSTVIIRFRPQSVGLKQATLVINCTDPDENPKTVPLTGTGVVPDIAVDPESLDFGEVSLGESSDLPLTISNVGGADLVVSDIAAEAPFSAAFDGEFTVAPGESREVVVTFAPEEAGD